MTTPTSLDSTIEYPDSDGQPMSDNTLQFEWIVTLQGNLDALFRDDPTVFVAGDLLWYPVEGEPTIRTAPDALVVFGRPKGYRGSYQQWREGGIAPQVVFEVLSPGNRPEEMERKRQFYDQHGVEEYYLYDPDGVRLSGWRRVGGGLQPIAEMNGWISPRLGIRFDLSGGELVIYRPDGQRFLTFLELAAQREQAQRLAEEERRAREQAQQRAEEERRAREQAQQQAEQERLAREQAQQQTEQARQVAEQERLAREQAQRAAEQERQAKEESLRRAQRLAEQLRALGIEPLE
jgi:Uma2 family endonuclease